MNVTVNVEQQLYVYHLAGGGFSCRGFQSLWDETSALATKLNADSLMPARGEFGSLTVQEKHNELISLASRSKPLGTWFDPRTPEPVCKALERARKSGEIVRLYYGDTTTGRSWLDENDVLGRIGRSMGVMKVPLLIEPGESGGPQLLDHCVVRIQAADGRDLYRHPSFHVPTLEICPQKDKRLPWAIHSEDGVQHAAFGSIGEAHAWIAFMHRASFPDKQWLQ